MQRTGLAVQRWARQAVQCGTVPGPMHGQRGEKMPCLWPWRSAGRPRCPSCCCWLAAGVWPCAPASSCLHRSCRSWSPGSRAHGQWKPACKVGRRGGGRGAPSVNLAMTIPRAPKYSTVYAQKCTKVRLMMHAVFRGMQIEPFLIQSALTPCSTPCTHPNSIGQPARRPPTWAMYKCIRSGKLSCVPLPRNTAAARSQPSAASASVSYIPSWCTWGGCVRLGGGQ